MGSYKDLTVWQKSIDLCERIYETTQKFPREELFGLSSQMRRSSISVPSNIAEGQKRSHKAEYIQFLRIAYGSGAELETQLFIAKRIGYLTNKEFSNLDLALSEIMKMLNKLLQVLQAKTYKLKPIS